MKIKYLIHWLPLWLCQPSHSLPFEVVSAFISSFKTQLKSHPFLIQLSRERFFGVWLSLAVQKNRQCYIYMTPCSFSVELSFLAPLAVIFHLLWFLTLNRCSIIK